MPFLIEHEPRPLVIAAPIGVRPVELFIGSGGMALEVAVLEADREPTIGQLRELHRERLGRRATPVVIVVLWGRERAAICGGPPESLSIHTDLDRGQVDRLCSAALAAVDRHAAIRYLAQALPQIGSVIPGLRNEGLFALHELSVGVPLRPDWPEAVQRSRALLSARGSRLIELLGFREERLPGPASLLVADGRKTAVAVFLDRPDEIEPPATRFDGMSPVSYALAKADHERLDYVIVSAGPALRIYPVKPGVGTGRRGRTETYLELNLDLLRERDAGHLWLLFSAGALADGGTFDQILSSSEQYAAELSTRLRERVYEDVVPQLALAIVKARGLREPTADQLAETFDMTLLVLFRLLFIAYAEDKQLLPLHSSEAYREHSLKHMARRLLNDRQGEVAWSDQDFYWTEVRQLWKAVDKGNPAWNIPAYNGGLFNEVGNRAALELTEISLPDSDFAPALAALLLDETPEGEVGPIDFRSLGVREFGTIYEGLLESELSIAETDLATRTRKRTYVPATERDEVVVRAGEVYLHNSSGERKSTGSYYTKSFAVEHLLDATLEPALDDHCARLDALDDKRAAARFFDFRVADVAMGSGHFLVAAVDRIERRLSNYLANRPLAEVTNELERLRKTALQQLGDEWVGEPLEDTQLLRRQIARRCIYGVDLNPLAVELARLSIWIHTFVPGLPLSFLDQNLVVGNSLVGIATFDEANDIVSGTGDLFSFTATERLARAREPLERLARLADATAAEVAEARSLYLELKDRTRLEAGLLTILAASRIDDEIRQAVDQGQIATLLQGDGDVFTNSLLQRAEDLLEDLDPLHFPIAFPQVFLGDRGGFDVIIGNPPWEEATVEEAGFWARHYPGLRGRLQREQEAMKAELREKRPDLVALFEHEQHQARELRRVLTAGAYPGMGTGDPDLYKAFIWRFWHLVAPAGGRIGVVLPRSALAARGSGEFREQIFSSAAVVDVTMLLNTAGWAFDDAEHRYTIGLVVIERSKSPIRDAEIRLRGPYNSLARFNAGHRQPPAVFSGEEVSSWSDSASLPLLPTDESLEVFAQLRRAPRLDLDDGQSWRARPHTELHATNDKSLMDLDSKECPKGYWPVFKGESFDIWTPDTGTYYAWADPERVKAALQQKRLRGNRNRRSPFSEFEQDWVEDETTLPCLRARVAFRDVSRATDSRTIRVALVPPRIFVANQAPYLLWPRGSEADQAYLLGVLSSIPLDWYARRFVENHVNFFILNPFPIPRPEPGDPLRERIIELAGRLAAPDERFAEWAAAAGVECGPLAEDDKEDMIYELDAVVAHLYGLSEPQLIHIFETFHEGWDYTARLEATLVHFRRLVRSA